MFGWYETSYVGLERTEAHTLLAGYLKGAEEGGVNIILDIVGEADTENTGIVN